MSVYVGDKWEKAAAMVFKEMNYYRDLWHDTMDDEEKQIICSMYYDFVARNGSDVHRTISKSAMKLKKLPTPDHWTCPRLVARAIMEANQWILDDFEEFKKIFRWCQSTIRVTSAQNNQVKYINEGDGVIYVKELTIDKYDKLFSSDAEEDSDYDKWHDGEGWSNEFPLKHTIPEWFTEFEKTLLLV